ncbi:hypothetical protein BHAOGJBA_6046 [Methylobacterium hispanicum]|uniref:HTH cro/C1-type domain-containing protein n=1 Tax=Methylobacterium hispanicum TaxID=270350 RepID=A0AAV4ZWN6_9HYPH|nr:MULTISPECIES: helix-turn-helix transcriptional regulator [Methylobacterium]GJD92492.1 hypothetical protein BHAOGJBA_6046 [Methylobacterium hispanicum]
MAGLKPMEADVRLGARLKRLRDGAGITQRQAAEVVGVSAAQFQKYEKGTNAISDLSLAKVARLLGRPITDFLDALEADAPEDCATDDLIRTVTGSVIAHLASLEGRALIAGATRPA